MKFIKTHSKKLLIGFALLLIVVCTCPLPRYINFDAPGWELDLSREDNPFGADAQISVKGLYFQFLFFESRMNLSVHIDSPTQDIAFKLNSLKPTLYGQNNKTAG